MIRLKNVEMEYDNGTKAIRGITLSSNTVGPPAPASPPSLSF